MTSSRAPANFLGYVEAFSCLNVDEAPVGPGLYAWYGTLIAGPQDWEMKLEGGEDRGLKACRTLLQKHTFRHGSPPISLEGRGAFTTLWRGDLRDVTAEMLASLLGEDVDELNDATDEDAYPSQFKKVLASKQTRELLLKLLQAATPILASPIYIGVALSLRTRLRQHVDQLYKFSEIINKNPEARTELARASKSTFVVTCDDHGFFGRYVDRMDAQLD